MAILNSVILLHCIMLVLYIVLLYPQITTISLLLLSAITVCVSPAAGITLGVLILVLYIGYVEVLMLVFL